MLLGALAFATYNLLMHKWRIPVTLIESLFLQAMSATILLLPLFLVAGTGVQGGAAIGCIAFAAIGASIMAPLAWMTGLHRLGSARVAGFFNLVPIVTALLAVVVLKESLSTWVVGGGLMAVFGVVLAEYAARKKPDEVMVVDDTSTKR